MVDSITSFDQNKLRHLAVSIAWDADKRNEIEQLLKDLMQLQREQDIPMLTIACALPEQVMEEFLRFYLKKKTLDEHQIKVSFIGKWYDCSQSLVELIKDLMKTTGDYTNYFLTFAVHYDGQEEIVDACKLMCRQIVADKLDIEQIDKMKLKQNMYTSYFVPPEVIVRVGGAQGSFHGFLLWDSYHARLEFTAEYSIGNVREMLGNLSD